MVTVHSAALVCRGTLRTLTQKPSRFPRGSREAVKLPEKAHRDPDRWVTPSIGNLEARSRQVQASMGNHCKYWDKVLRPGLKDGVID